MTTVKFKTLNYFARNLIDPMFEVFEVLDNKEHPEHDNLMSDIKNIDTNDLDAFVEKYHIENFLGRHEDKELGKRAYFIIFNLQKEIANTRVKKLTDFDKIPEPYNSKNLSDIKYDKNFLISTDYFNLSYYR